MRDIFKKSGIAPAADNHVYHAGIAAHVPGYASVESPAEFLPAEFQKPAVLQDLP